MNVRQNIILYGTERNYIERYTYRERTANDKPNEVNVNNRRIWINEIQVTFV